MNKPYVKQYNKLGEVTNAITKENPYLHQSPNRSFTKKLNSGKYHVITDPRTGAFISFGNKVNGNNRANTCKRKNKNSRKYGKRLIG